MRKRIPAVWAISYVFFLWGRRQNCFFGFTSNLHLSNLMSDSDTNMHKCMLQTDLASSPKTPGNVIDRERSSQMAQGGNLTSTYCWKRTCVSLNSYKLIYKAHKWTYFTFSVVWKLFASSSRVFLLFCVSVCLPLLINLFLHKRPPRPSRCSSDCLITLMVITLQLSVCLENIILELLSNRDLLVLQENHSLPLTCLVSVGSITSPHLHPGLLPAPALHLHLHCTIPFLNKLFTPDSVLWHLRVRSLWQFHHLYAD